MSRGCQKQTPPIRPEPTKKKSSPEQWKRPYRLWTSQKQEAGSQEGKKHRSAPWLACESKSEMHECMSVHECLRAHELTKPSPACRSRCTSACRLPLSPRGSAQPGAARSGHRSYPPRASPGCGGPTHRAAPPVNFELRS